MLKNTRKRNEVLGILKETHNTMTAQDIYLSLKDKVDINLSTVYRALDMLEKNELVKKEVRQDKKAYYEYNDHIHKHHLVCTKCNNDLPIDACPIKQLEENIEEMTGYEITDHVFAIRGICPKCRGKNK